MELSLPSGCKPKFLLLLFVKIGIVALITSVAQTHAQTVQMQTAPPRQLLPEAIIVPLKSQGRSNVTAGWVLLYRNNLRGAQTPDVVVEGRSVTLRSGTDDGMHAVITWKITRTRNDSCVSATLPSCPDRIEILSVPVGFRAFPESSWIDEGEGIQIFIVRAGVG